MLLTNQIYKGIRKWNGGENETKVPAIIDETTWDSVYKNLEENKKNPWKKNEYHYLLKWIGFLWNMRERVQGGRKDLREEPTPTNAKVSSEFQSYVLHGH